MLTGAAPIAAGFLLLASFVWWERRAPYPMIASEVMKLRRFTTSCGVYLVSRAALTAVYFYLTLLYLDVDGWTALRTGLSWLFMNVPFLVVAQFAGGLSRRLSATVIVAGGCLVTAAGVITFSTLTPSSPFGQARNVAGARIGSVANAFWASQRAAAEQAFPHGYAVAVLVARLCLVAAAVLAAFGLRHDPVRPVSPQDSGSLASRRLGALPNG